MKATIDIKSLVLGCLLGALVVYTIAATTDRTTTWEYRVVTLPTTNPPGTPALEKLINEAVAEGWELHQACAGDPSGPFGLMRRPKK